MDPREVSLHSGPTMVTAKGLTEALTTQRCRAQELTADEEKGGAGLWGPHRRWQPAVQQ
jgi:hypothetical protein